MADHVRKQIQDRAVTLCTGLTTTGSNVFLARSANVGESQVPCLLIYTDEEEVEEEEFGVMGEPQFQYRVCTLNIVGAAQGSDEAADNELDTIAKEVETAIAGDATLNGLAKRVRLLSSEKERAGEGDGSHTKISMEFEVIYFTTADTPDTAE